MKLTGTRHPNPLIALTIFNKAKVTNITECTIYITNYRMYS